MIHFSTTYQLRYHEIDQFGRPRIPALMTWLQDTAILHTKSEGLDMADLLVQGVTFVLSRLHFVLTRYPVPGETVSVDTWIACCDQRFMVREYRLTGGDGAVIALATTSLSMICFNNRLPVNIDDFLPEYPSDPVRAVDDPFDSLPEVSAAEYLISLPVLRSDLDRNDHVNNTIYAAWAIESLPEEIVASHEMTGLEIRYRSEARYGEMITVETQEVYPPDQPGRCLLHRISANADQRELARLVTCWRSTSL